jgi:DNA adenine methylase
MNKLSKPVSFFGGKGELAKRIIEHFPSFKEMGITTYIEPFGGSYGVGLKLTELPEVEIYNDLWSNVYSLYKVISDKNLFIEFKDRCDLTVYSEELWKEYKTLLKRNDLTIVDRAFYYFYTNRTSRNGVGGFSTNLVVRRKMGKSISDMLSAIDGMYDLHQRLSRVIVLNRDAIELIKKYDMNHVFFYQDPPYHQSTRTSARYSVDMDGEQQKVYLDTLLNIRNAKVLVSGYACDEYKILEENGWERIDYEVKTVSGTNERKTKIESLWKNY